MNTRRIIAVAGVLVIALSAPAGRSVVEAHDGKSALERRAQEPDSVPGSAPAGWLAQVKEDIRRSEYNVTMAKCVLPDVEEAYQAPNRKCGVRTYFLPDGVAMVPRTGSEPRWEVGCQVSLLRSSSYGGQAGVRCQVSLGKPELVVEKNRAEYRYNGITEWYVNDERGVEQGWTIEGIQASVPDTRHATPPNSSSCSI